MQFSKHFSFLVFFLTYCLAGCKGQSDKEKECVQVYNNALKAYAQYYSLQAESSLLESLNYLNQAITCDRTRLKAVNLKISVLVLLKRFEAAAQFVDSLDQNALGQPYKKAMVQNYIVGLYLESKGDTAGRNSNFLKSVTVIQNYIESNEKGHSTVDEGVYYDLLLMKLKVFGIELVIKDIEDLVIKFPGKREYFEALKETFKDEAVDVFPTMESIAPNN